MEPTQQQIFNVFKKTPAPIRKYLVSAEAANDIASLGKNKSLSGEQTSKLAKQSGYFLMNIVPADALAGNIQYELGIDAQLAETLAQYIKGVIKVKSERVVVEPVVAATPTPQPVAVPIRRIVEPTSNPVPLTKVIPAGEVSTPAHLDENLPAILPEREVTVRKIVTENAILNRQLEVPVIHPIETPKPRPIVQATTPKVTSASIVDTRLKGTYSFPKTEVNIKPPQQNTVPRVDPYREPAE